MTQRDRQTLPFHAAAEKVRWRIRSAAKCAVWRPRRTRPALFREQAAKSAASPSSIGKRQRPDSDRPPDHPPPIESHPTRGRTPDARSWPPRCGATVPAGSLPRPRRWRRGGLQASTCVASDLTRTKGACATRLSVNVSAPKKTRNSKASPRKRMKPFIGNLRSK